MAYGNHKIGAYQQANNQSAAFSDPHRLVQMLMESSMTRLATARGAIERNDIETKNREIGKATSIFLALADGLDYEQGGELAENLGRLYDYMVRETLHASRHNDPERLAGVSQLMSEIKEGWDGIREQALDDQGNNQQPTGISASG